MPATGLQQRIAPQLAQPRLRSRAGFSSKAIISPCRIRWAGPRGAVASPADIKLEAMENADRRRAPTLPYRIGHGFDLHRLEEGPYKLILGGLEIPHDRGCVAHSDAGLTPCTCPKLHDVKGSQVMKDVCYHTGDALLHTVTDAILGALSQPDIGQLFPDSDPKWKGQTSDVFVKEAVRLMHDHGYELGNLDATIILQRPKLSPHKERIRENLCQLLDAHPSTINIKAKTHEKVDSLGENRSIAVHAVCMLIRKDLMQ